MTRSDAFSEKDGIGLIIQKECFGYDGLLKLNYCCKPFLHFHQDMKTSVFECESFKRAEEFLMMRDTKREKFCLPSQIVFVQTFLLNTFRGDFYDDENEHSKGGEHFRVLTSLARVHVELAVGAWIAVWECRR